MTRRPLRRDSVHLVGVSCATLSLVDFARLAFGLLLGRRLPIAHGSLALRGISGSIEISRDRWGVPHIRAGSEADAWFGLGFCHGQDRAFQLESLLRLVRGTVAEVVGVDAIALDRLSRRIGFHRSAARQLPVLSDGVRASVEAYANGVTAGETAGLRHRPHELVLLRRRPTAWTAADVLAVGKLQACLMVSCWDTELARLRILADDGAEALAALDPSYPPNHPVTAPPGAPAGAAIDRLASDIARFTAATGVAGGSNSWALVGSRTATGRPLLANDPHLAPTLPSPWYLCHIQTPEWACAGASFAGAPGIAAGHNGLGAWGLTAGCVDNADLFLEQIGLDGRSVREGDAFVACPLHSEQIRVRGGQTVVEEVLETRRGPIIGPALDGEKRAISLRAVWLDALPLEGLLYLPRSRSFEQFRHCFASWPGPSLNMTYAHADGSIGWQLAGQAPKRRRGHGRLPTPGWLEDAGWEQQHIPFDEMPWVRNPSAGFVASANNRPLPAGEGPFLGEDWADGFRMARIVEALARRDDWDVAGTMALQLDQRSLVWRAIRERVLASPPQNPDTRIALELLESWDGSVSATSAAASVFELFVSEMTLRIARAKAPRSYAWALSRGFSRLMPHTNLDFRRAGHLVQTLLDRPDDWFERSWPDETADALAAAVARLRSLRGAPADRWGWGSVRPLTLTHPMSRRRLLGRVFNLGPFPWGGDTNTIGQAGVDLIEPLSQPNAIAGLRLVVDVGAWDKSRFALAGGQSGNPCSPHYADQLPLWRRGEGIPIAWDEGDVNTATREMLRLVPAGAESLTGGC